MKDELNSRQERVAKQHKAAESCVELFTQALPELEAMAQDGVHLMVMKGGGGTGPSSCNCPACTALALAEGKGPPKIKTFMCVAIGEHAAAYLSKVIAEAQNTPHFKAMMQAIGEEINGKPKLSIFDRVKKVFGGGPKDPSNN